MNEKAGEVSRRQLESTPKQGPTLSAFLGLVLVILSNSFTPLSIAAELVERHEIEVLQRTREMARPA